MPYPTEGGVSWRLFAFLVVLALVLGVAGKAWALDQKLFADLVADLDGKSFAVREKAQGKLIDAAKMKGGLTAAQVRELQRLSLGAKGASLELQQRAGRVFQETMAGSEAAKKIIQLLNIKADGTTGKFTFGDATGSYDPKNDEQVRLFNTLQKHWEAIALAIDEGDAKAVADGYDALDDELKRNRRIFSTLNMQFGGHDFTYFNFRNLGRNVVRPALDKLSDQIKKKGADPAPAPMRPAPVPGAGNVPLGLSLALNIGEVLHAGGLDVIDQAPALSRVLPPAGKGEVGHIYDLNAVQGLEVGGQIEIQIDYGSKQLIGNPVVNPASLDILRYADGVSTLLPLDAAGTDPGGDLIAGYYDVGASSRLMDQFGEFVVVQTIPEIPEPRPMLLMAIGGAALWSRRRFLRAPDLCKLRIAA
jgi:hypothetical protein